MEQGEDTQNDQAEPPPLANVERIIQGDDPTGVEEIRPMPINWDQIHTSGELSAALRWNHPAEFDELLQGFS